MIVENLGISNFMYKKYEWGITLLMKTLLIIISLFFYSNLLLAEKNDSATKLTGLPPTGFGTIADWHCVHQGTVTCLAVGSKNMNGKTIPLLLKSIDGANHWTEETVANLPSEGELLATDCFPDGSFCFAVGQTFQDGKPNGAFLVQSQDSTTTWRVVPLPYYPSLELNFATCTRLTGVIVGTSFCVLAGSYNNGLNPVIIQTRDGGIAWQGYDFEDITQQRLAARHLSSNLMYEGNCAGAGKLSTCKIYVSKKIDNGYQELYMLSTFNQGVSWVYSPK